MRIQIILHTGMRTDIPAFYGKWFANRLREGYGQYYDPIFISKDYPVERHIHDFEQMAGSLAGYTDTCVISFIDLYNKVLRNFPEVREVPKTTRIELAKQFVAIGKKYNMTIKSCAEGTELEEFGVDCSGCMTKAIFEKAINSSLDVPKTKGARLECGCLLGCDIGAYNTCGHFCRYCYANDDKRTEKRSELKYACNTFAKNVILISNMVYS